jgi:hypothetical protein
LNDPDDTPFTFKLKTKGEGDGDIQFTPPRAKQPSSEHDNAYVRRLQDDGFIKDHVEGAKDPTAAGVPDINLKKPTLVYDSDNGYRPEIAVTTNGKHQIKYQQVPGKYIEIVREGKVYNYPVYQQVKEGSYKLATKAEQYVFINGVFWQPNQNLYTQEEGQQFEVLQGSGFYNITGTDKHRYTSKFKDGTPQTENGQTIYRKMEEEDVRPEEQ